nr:hypothetical protein [Chryseolinea lacunae]
MPSDVPSPAFFKLCKLDKVGLGVSVTINWLLECYFANATASVVGNNQVALGVDDNIRREREKGNGNGTLGVAGCTSGKSAYNINGVHLADAVICSIGDVQVSRRIESQTKWVLKFSLVPWAIGQSPSPG